MERAVKIMNMHFDPRFAQVHRGATVTWVNNDSVAHTVTGDDGSGSLLHSARLNPGQSYSVMFPDTGTYSYHCSIHPEMHGTVQVIK